MQQRIFFGQLHLCLIFLLCNSVHSLTLTNMCPDTPSCNCTLDNDTDLTIVCSSMPSLTQLPTLSPNTSQINVTKLSVLSSTVGTNGPLITLPTNICSYPNLAILDLSSNNISGLVNTSELACLGSALIRADFSKNNIDSIDKNFFQSNKKLQTIDFSQNSLTTMPLIDGSYFVSFTSTITNMNFSFNQIVSADLWPLFVITRNTMTIDMSHNLVKNFTNTVPISLTQFSEPPDPRYYYLNNNFITDFSDILLERYGACSTTNTNSAAFFVVGISNLLLTENQLACECESYNLITFIDNGISDFPSILNGSALISQATCSSPPSMAGQKFIFANFSSLNNCANYILPNATDIYCSYTPNSSIVTLAPPTYWPSTTTTATILTSDVNSTAVTNNANTNGSSTSSSWYIILGVVLGLVAVFALVMTICYLYQKMTVSKVDGLKGRTRRTSTSTSGFDSHGKNGNGGLDSDPNRLKGYPYLNDGSHPDEGTQTCFEPVRSKPPSGRDIQAGHNNHLRHTLRRQRKPSAPSGVTDASTNTANAIKGIPMPSIASKLRPAVVSEADSNSNRNSSQLSITNIPLLPSRRAKVLPQVKNAIYTDSNTPNLLNTSAGALITSQRQRRRSSLWPRRQTQNMISPLPPRPRSVITPKNSLFDSDGSIDENLHLTPTFESLGNKPSKPIRTVPLLNITVGSTWTNDIRDSV